MERAYELVLYGATGFPYLIAYAGYTGKLAARYIYENCPTNLKWAVGGRSREKLEKVAGENRRPGIIVADADDFEALEALAKSTKVVISVAGPFLKYGSKLVRACAENGTHYADITGETPWYSSKKANLGFAK